MQLLKQAKSGPRLFVGLGLAFLLFDLNVYLMATLPGSHNNACVEGANLTWQNLIFSGLISILTALLLLGFYELRRQKQTENKIALSSLSGFSLVMAQFTIFCGFCSIPLLATTGLAGLTQLITEYSLWFQLLSLGLLLASCYFLNQQLEKNCGLWCKIKN